jgi:hypothetical protein
MKLSNIVAIVAAILITIPLLAGQALAYHGSPDLAQSELNRASVKIQEGRNNVATITQTDLAQDEVGAREINHASVLQHGNQNTAVIQQTGLGNTALISQTGNMNHGSITQSGNSGYASITQVGSGNTATINQR